MLFEASIAVSLIMSFVYLIIGFGFRSMEEVKLSWQSFITSAIFISYFIIAISFFYIS